MPKEDSNSLDCDERGKVQCLDSDIEKKLRVPLLEILKYPYLLLHKRLSEYLEAPELDLVLPCIVATVFESSY